MAVWVSEASTPVPTLLVLLPEESEQVSGLTDSPRLRDKSGNYWQSCEGCVITETHGDIFY